MLGGGGGGGGAYPWPHYGSVAPAWPHDGSVTPDLTMSLLPQASLWLCYPWPRYGSVTWPHYGSVTPGLTTLPVCVTEILIYCLIEPFPAFLVYNLYVSERLTTISPYEAACLHAR